MTSSTPDRYTYDLRTPHPNVDLDTVRRGAVQAIDDLSETVAVLAEAQAGVDDGYFLSDLLFQMVGETMAEVAGLSRRRTLLAARAVPLPLLAVGSSDLTVSWGANLGSANYQVEFADNGALLGKVAYEVKTTYATSCVLTLRTTVAVPLGAALELTAVRYT